jgi:hypothetical protein
MRFLTFAIAALALTACTQTGSLQTGFVGAQPKPKLVLVSDFTIAPEVVAIDRGYTARLDRKFGSIPTYQRKQSTLERVNDEIVANIVTTLRAAGFDARLGGEDTLTLDQSALVITGALRPNEPITDKNKNSFGFGAGRGHVVAAVSGSLFSAGGKREMLAFDVESAGGKREPAMPPKLAASNNAAIASVIAAGGGATERLSPDVEAPARRLGRAIGDRVLAFAKEQGWLEAATPESNPDRKPDQKPENKPEQSGSDAAQPNT